MKFCVRFKRLLKNSVITGIPQILVTRNTFRKSIKLFVFSGCIFGFFWQTSTFLEVYWTYPTVVDVQYFFPESFDLPAISVCDYNGIKSKPFCKKFPELCSPHNSLEEFCIENTHLCDQNYLPGNETLPTVKPRDLPPLSREEYRDMGMQPEDLIEACYIVHNQEISNCTGPDILNVFDIKAIPSNCYTFNGFRGVKTGSMKINIKSRVILKLKSAKGSANRFYTGSPFALQVCLHSPYGILNPFYNGFAVTPGFTYLVFPSKEVNERLPSPYASKCFNYSAMWETRSGFGPLSKRLCTEECHLNESLEHFGCVDPYFIRYPNMAPICPAKQERDIYSECKELCPTTCYSEEISVDVQELPLPKYKNAIPRDNFARSFITFSFNRMVLVRYKYSPKYESVSLFSYIGGYLGLWLGISLVAICDVIETTLLIGQWIIEKLKRYKRNKIKVHHENPTYEYSIKFRNEPRELWIL